MIIVLDRTPVQFLLNTASWPGPSAPTERRARTGLFKLQFCHRSLSVPHPSLFVLHFQDAVKHNLSRIPNAQTRPTAQTTMTGTQQKN